MKFIQAVVFFAVYGSNIEYRWVDNSVAAGLVAFMAVMVVTRLIVGPSLRTPGHGSEWPPVGEKARKRSPPAPGYNSIAVRQPD